MTHQEAARFLSEHDNYFILNHKRPDGDTIGCGVGLCNLLRTVGKTDWLLASPDGIVSAPFHQTNAEGLDVCMLRSVALVIEDVGDAEEFAQAWADELTDALSE